MTPSDGILVERFAAAIRALDDAAEAERQLDAARIEAARPLRQRLARPGSAAVLAAVLLGIAIAFGVRGAGSPELVGVAISALSTTLVIALSMVGVGAWRHATSGPRALAALAAFEKASARRRAVEAELPALAVPHSVEESESRPTESTP